MMAFKLTRLILHLVVGLWTCAFVFPFVNKAGRTARIQRWSARLLSLCNVQLDIIDQAGAPASSHALVVANHISWLDIFVINSWHPCHFVAKSEIRDWPVLGWLCEKAGTVFIARGKLRDVRRIYEGLVHSLQQGEQVAFFPEGGTSEQGKLLPFHSNLFESAVEARVPLQPFALRYMVLDRQSNQFHPAVLFIDDIGFMESMMTILKAGGIRAELIRLPLIDTAGCHRRHLAQMTRQAIVGALDSLPNERAA